MAMGNNVAFIDAVDGDRLDVYRVAREFDAFAVRVLPPPGVRFAARSASAGEFFDRSQHRRRMRAVREAGEGQLLLDRAGQCDGMRGGARPRAVARAYRPGRP